MKPIRILFFVFLFSGSFHLNAQEDTTIYEFCDTVAEFPGDQGAMNSYLMKNLQVKEGYSVDHVSCFSYFISFVVEKNGTISNVSFPRNPDNYCAEMEAILRDIYLKMPAWKPAIKNGVAVRSRYSNKACLLPK